MKPQVVAVIPARLGSTRFPDKVIYPLNGKPLLYYLVKSLKKSKLIDRLIIATDSKEIQQAMEPTGTEVIMTSKRHRTGSDRAAEIAQKIKAGILLNIQADNFGLTASVVDKAIERFISDSKESFATLVTKISDDDDLIDPNTVKTAMSKDGHALWFSRYPVPYVQNPSEGPISKQAAFYHHVGVYLFRRAALLRFGGWKRSPLEKTESLEQLRILENGERIRGYISKTRSISVDCPADLEKISSLYTRTRHV